MTGDDDRRPPDPSRIRPYVDGVVEVSGQPAEYPPEAGAVQPPPEAPAVRPYLLTGGRVRPLDASLEIEAQVRTTPAGQADADRLAFEHRDIVVLCEQPIAIAEIAARLGLHLSVARVLASDLIEAGYLVVRRPEAGAHQNKKIIERVIRGLQAIS
ncbi:DUF742 domain-containing protein [Planosporangium mesophilum]|uniref:DUF742 domain-containing protein n=1 Tax=Planosporangium mesophilum TaxID=689768 RepID=A0A8J3TG57_9ACTN|nr:DUF742 domain-containing protein [Planosporangium mesophilum]NJC81448.1 DUF742 domain-containing protein [Planosporangium mesophilum]GII20895.1 hypothetical protein Pme01_04920 [Planosporangium mesophilum]